MKRFLAVLAFLIALESAEAQTPTIAYTLTVKNPVSHLFDVEMEIAGVPSTRVVVAMPAWAPGVPAIRDFARNVQQFEALTLEDRPLVWEQIDKQTWQISKAVNDEVRVRYKVYSTALNDEMADVTPASVFMYASAFTQIPVSVKFNVDGGWKVHTALEERGDAYRAASYDELVSSPAFLGVFKVLEVKSAAGIPYTAVFSNSRLQMTDPQVEADLEDLANAAASMFGTVPFRKYVFFVKVQPPPQSAAVGYVTSSRLTAGENDFVSESSYSTFLASAAQGIVRSWNGRLLRGPIDYSRESYSRSLWFTEGVSAYIADMLLLRTGVLLPTQYLQKASAEIDALQHQPGRLLTSLEDASWNAWTRSDNAANAGISYVLKGKIAGMLLDAEIRAKTSGAKTLEEVLKYITTNNGNVTTDSLPQAIQSATGVDVRESLESLVRGKAEITYSRYLEGVGVRVTSAKSPASITFGIEFERLETNQARIRRVLPNSSAEAARLDAGDIIVALESDRVTFDNLVNRIHSVRVGRPAAITVLRGERLLNLSIVPAMNQTETWSVAESPSPTPEQLRLRKAWLGI